MEPAYHKCEIRKIKHGNKSTQPKCYHYFPKIFFKKSIQHNFTWTKFFPFYLRIYPVSQICFQRQIFYGLFPSLHPLPPLPLPPSSPSLASRRSSGEPWLLFSRVEVHLEFGVQLQQFNHKPTQLSLVVCYDLDNL